MWYKLWSLFCRLWSIVELLFAFLLSKVSGTTLHHREIVWSLLLLLPGPCYEITIADPKLKLFFILKLF